MPTKRDIEEMATAAGVSKRTAADALWLAQQSPELLDKVAKGELSLAQALRHAKRATRHEAAPREEEAQDLLDILDEAL